jgi:hypothetical protein
MHQRVLDKSVLAAGCFVFSFAAPAQTTNYIVDQFDSNIAGLYVNQQWGTVVPAITWDDTQNAVTILGPDNAGSGSARWVIPWMTTGDQIEVTRAFNNGTVLNLNIFTSVSFDIRFATNSATDGKGSYGAVEVDCVPQSAGWPSTTLAIYTSSVASGNGWIHVNLPVNAAGNTNLVAVTGLGIKIRQSQTGENLSGTTTFWIDNIIFSGFATPLVTGPTQIIQLNAAQPWQRLEFQITNIPVASNPFDPGIIALDATFTLPSGRTMVVPAFWYQEYQRALSGGTEYDIVSASPQWRLRFTPPESGTYTVSLVIQTNNQPCGVPVNTNFIVPASAPARFGYVGNAPSRQYFQTGDSQPLRLIGANVCWPVAAGTYDYDTWFPAMQNAGEDYARIWMWPWAFGIEDTPASLNNYSLQPAWQLDYVFQQAEQHGIYLLLCLDYHGMFATEPDYWGGNNVWPQNPYNITNGGPCTVANDFFTNATAMKIYQKRLRYLIARYGYSQNLLAWELFNEIDNDYAFLNSTNVAAWHGVMGGWMHTNDVFGHLVTTSLTSGSDRPEIWTLPQLDFAAYHSYGEPGPAARLSAVAQSFLQRYGKPVMVGEFGTDWQGWNRTNDPYLRGWREGIWGGALGGSVGTAMSWYWDLIQSENDYPVYSALGAILNRTGWERGRWTNINFQTSGTPPSTVGDPIPGGQPFNVQLPLDGGWADMTPGRLAIPNASAANYSASTLKSFVHGIWHSDLKTPFQLSAWFTNNAQLIMHLNSVSDGSIMVVLADNARLFTTNLQNLDGGYDVDEEYNTDISVNLPAGKHIITITNAGNDWFYLDWVQLNQVLPATYAANWQPSPEAIGLRGPHESLLYVVSPDAAFPAGGTNATLPLQHGQMVILTNWPAGNFFAEWYDPASAAFIGMMEAVTANGSLTLLLPDFSEDLAGIVYPPPMLISLGIDGTRTYQFGIMHLTKVDSKTVLFNRSRLHFTFCAWRSFWLA